LGALLFNSIAIVANSKICTVAPLAYQNGPDTPYLYAMADDCRRVAWKLVFSQMGVVSGGDIVLGENHKTGQNKKWVFPQHLPAQVQEETTADATRPDFTVLPAVLNISEVCSSLL